MHLGLAANPLGDLRQRLKKEANSMEGHGLLSMPGVGFFGMLIIGLTAGYIAEKVTASDHGLLTNLIVGIAGSFVGGTLAGLVNIEFYGWLGNLIVASVGAVLLLWVWRRGSKTKNSLWHVWDPFEYRTP